MKVSIFINKHEHKRDIPLSYDQVSFGNFINLDRCGTDKVKVMSLFWRLDYETLCKAKIKNMDEVISKLAFLDRRHPLLHPTQEQPLTPELIRQYIPKELYGYPLPTNLEWEETQQYIDLKTYVSESKDLTPIQQLERYTIYCAVYAVKHLKGKYSWEEAEKLAPVFLNAPCTEVMAIGNFTLLRLIGLNLNTNPGSQKAGSRMQRFRLALKGWAIRTVSISRWTIWLKKLGAKRMNY
jgi:hypothetical protein